MPLDLERCIELSEHGAV